MTSFVVYDSEEEDEGPLIVKQDVIEVENEYEYGDIQSLIIAHKTINVANAIVLNEALIAQLKALLSRLEESLEKCRRKYEDNDKILSHVASLKWKDSNLSKEIESFEVVRDPTQYSGAPYFKTRRGRPAALNEEALYRRSQGTLYPMDFHFYVRTLWTMADKMMLLRLIKTSLFQHCVTKEKIKVTKTTSLSDLVGKISDKSFQLNWAKISDDMFGRHSPFECQAMWKLTLHPRLRRSKWSGEEDDKLLEVAKQHNYQNWERIAGELGTQRSMFQCFLRYQTTFFSTNGNPEKGRAKFTKEEDKQLLSLVNEHRVGNLINWSKITQIVGTRTKQALYYRYEYSLRPNICRERFSVEEDCIFLAALQEYGLNFPKIGTEFPNRTLVQLRSHYNSVLKRNSETKPWTVSEDKKLLQLMKEGKTWAQIAEVITTHTRQMCRARSLVLKKFFKDFPGKPLKDAPRRKRPGVNNVTTSNWADKIVNICQNMREVGQREINNTALKLASFLQLLDTEISDSILQTHSKDFTEGEMKILKTALAQEKEQLIDIPIHRPTLVAFEKLRKLEKWKKGQSSGLQRTYSEKTKVERENFKKQFKALFYLPAILATMKADEDKRTSTIETEFGTVTIHY